jgi:hypothetical protein
MADSTAARAAVAVSSLDSDRIGILPAVLHTAEAKALEGSAQSAIGLTPWARGGWN